MADIRLCLVTSNEHKYREIKAIGEGLGVEVYMCTVPKLEVQGDSLEEIAYKSALLAYLYLNRPLMVEDAGLYIKALNGFPGPYSNYVFKTIGLAGILKLMNGVEDRRACFKSAVAVVLDNYTFISTGEVCGYIAESPRGTRGFGFDPIFIPEGETRTFGEMSIEEKNRYSHRAVAVRKALTKVIQLKSNTGL